MAKIVLVRHGKAAASFTDDADPGLDSIGQQQAEMVVPQLMAMTNLEILSSPLKRAQETATPYALAVDQSVSIESRVAEIPSPGLSLEERGPWLQGVMAGTWDEQSEQLLAWRQDLQQALVDLKQDTVLFSHFVAINVAVGLATEANEVFVFRPGNASVTILNNDNGTLQLEELGSEAETHIN